LFRHRARELAKTTGRERNESLRLGIGQAISFPERRPSLTNLPAPTAYRHASERGNGALKRVALEARIAAE